MSKGKWIAGIAMLAALSSTKQRRDEARRWVDPLSRVLFVLSMILVVAWVVIDLGA